MNHFFVWQGDDQRGDHECLFTFFPQAGTSGAPLLYNEGMDQEVELFARAREITDSFGGRLKIAVEARVQGAKVVLERPSVRGCPRAVLDAYGAELLWGFIMAARVAGNQEFPDECAHGENATRIRLAHDPRPAIILIQAGLERPFEIPATFWDRLYAELCLVLPHVRALDCQPAAV
jgi:hypothetical protein